MGPEKDIRFWPGTSCLKECCVTIRAGLRPAGCMGWWYDCFPSIPVAVLLVGGLNMNAVSRNLVALPMRIWLLLMCTWHVSIQTNGCAKHELLFTQLSIFFLITLLHVNIQSTRVNWPIPVYWSVVHWIIVRKVLSERGTPKSCRLLLFLPLGIIGACPIFGQKHSKTISTRPGKTTFLADIPVTQIGISSGRLPPVGPSCKFLCKFVCLCLTIVKTTIHEYTIIYVLLILAISS